MRVGIIGCGTISSTYLKTAQHLNEISVSACADNGIRTNIGCVFGAVLWIS